MSPRNRISSTLAAVGLAALITAPSAVAQTSANGDLAFHAPAFGAFSDRHYDIFVQSPGGDPQNVTSDSGGWETNPDWSPDGNKIVFTSNRTGWNEVYVMNADGSGVEQLTSGDGEFDESWGARFSPDGRRIVYTYDPRMGSGGDADIIVMDADGTNKRNITDPWEDLQYDDYAPSWSSDGSRLVFGAIREGTSGGGNFEIVTSNPDGSGQQRLMGAANALWVEYPSFSPDGTKIVYMAADHAGSNWDVWVMNADGSVKENVTQHPAGDDYPTWSNDGSRIFFTSNRGDGSTTDLYEIPYPAPVFASRRFTARAASVERTASASAVASASLVQDNVLNPDFAPAVAPADRTASLTDDGPRPRTLRTKPGLLVRWTNTGTRAHRIREAVLVLLDSGRLAVDGTFDHRFVGAGTYTLRDSTTEATQTVEVLVNAVRRARGDGRTIGLTWGSEAIPDGSRVYDVQVRKPGAARFVAVASTGRPGGDWVAPKAGAYEFRARFRVPGAGASGWSPVRTIDVP